MQSFLQLLLTSMFSYMRRKALNPSGCDSMLDTARSVLRMCSRMSACIARGRSCFYGVNHGVVGHACMHAVSTSGRCVKIDRAYKGASPDWLLGAWIPAAPQGC